MKGCYLVVALYEDVLINAIFIPILCESSYPHFTDEEIKVHKGWQFAQGSPSQQGQDGTWKPMWSVSRALLLITPLWSLSIKVKSSHQLQPVDWQTVSYRRSEAQNKRLFWPPFQHVFFFLFERDRKMELHSMTWGLYLKSEPIG